jgi:hypothetical protein
LISSKNIFIRKLSVRRKKKKHSEEEEEKNNKTNLPQETAHGMLARGEINQKKKFFDY